MAPMNTDHAHDDEASQAASSDPLNRPRGASMSTALIHHHYQPPAGFDSPAVAVHRAATVFFPNVATMRSRQWVDRSSYTYGLHGTPTTFTLEQRLATLEGARHVTLVPSGLAAISLVDMALLKSGDHVLLPNNVYMPSRHFAQHDLVRWGVTHALYDAQRLDALSAALTPATRLVWLEAPGSVTLEFPDLRGLGALIRHQAPQATIALDNTWGAGLAFAPFELGDGLGVDISVQALTKYPSGGGDVLMGSVSCRDEALHETLTLTHSRVGFNVGLDDVHAILRSLPSMALRYAHQDAAARRIARWCQSRPEVAQVLHPALKDSPGHAHWANHCQAAAGLLALVFEPKFSAAQVDGFVDALKLFRIGYSWGGPYSLAVPYALASMRPRDAAQHPGGLVRLCIGLEGVDDLLSDLAQAFDALR